MKNRIKIIISSFALILFLTTACSKYDENTGISLKTKKARLCREWVRHFSEYDVVWEFEKNNNLIISRITEHNTFANEYMWEFSENKETIEVDWDWYSYTYKIDSFGYWMYDDNGKLIIEDSVFVDEPDLTIIKLTLDELIVDIDGRYELKAKK